ncbi:MAG: hypothetical protein GC129_01685 [Proteobacteria bacterium]|nr:hypothetical protein [Pseudomonadota bacterium]
MAPTLPPSPARRKRAAWWRAVHPHRKGQVAEFLALTALLLKGYRPAPRPLRALAQTDLLLTKGPVLALVEVKCRTSRARAHLALTPAQKQRLTRQARALAARHPSRTVRLELVLLFPHWPFVEHLPRIDAR